MIGAGRVFRVSFAVGAMALSVATNAAAADLPAEVAEPVLPKADPWVFTVTPYFWAADLKGDVRVFPRLPTVHVDLSFDQIFDYLDFAAMGATEIRKERFGFLTDLQYISTTAEGKGEIKVRDFPISVGAKLESTIFNTTAAAFYAVHNSRTFEFDVLAGGRFWAVDTDLKVTLGSLPPLKGDSSFSWFDPIIGARARVNFNERFSATVYGDLGGFGVGSEFTWQAWGTLNYAFNEHWTASAGYRYLAVDYRDDGHVFDVAMGGPVMAVSYKF